MTFDKNGKLITEKEVVKKRIRHDERAQVCVLNEEDKHKAGLDVKKVRDFSGGCSGLRVVEEKKD